MIVDEETYLHYEIEYFLEHHGVKGMHWGISTEEPTGNSKNTKGIIEEYNNQLNKHGGFNLTDKQKKIILGGVLIGAGLIGVGLTAKFGMKPKFSSVQLLAKERALLKPGDPISRNLYVKLFNESVTDRIGSSKSAIYRMEHEPGFTISKGLDFKRISFNSETGFGDRPFTWVTHGKADGDRYKSVFGSAELGVTKEISIKAASDIKFPSTEELVHSIQESLGTKGILASKETALKHVILGNDKESLAVINNLKTKGYGGIIDFNDAGMIGERPLIIFNSPSIGKFIPKDITNQEWKKASDSLIEMKTRRWHNI